MVSVVDLPLWHGIVSAHFGSITEIRVHSLDGIESLTPPLSTLN